MIQDDDDRVYATKLLNEAMSELIFGPGGDPGLENLRATARIHRVMERLNLPITCDIAKTLRSENICNCDFLDEVDKLAERAERS